MSSYLEYDEIMRKRKRRGNKALVAIGIASAVSIILVVIYAAIQYRIHPDTPPPMEVIVEEGTIVYASVGRGSRIINRVEGKQPLQVMGRDPSGRWLQIDYHGKPGWVHVPPPNAYSMIFSAPITGGILKGSIDHSGQFKTVFYETNRASDRAGQLVYKDEFVIVGRHETPGWIFIQSDNAQGWINLRALSGDASFADLPLITEGHAAVLMGIATPAPPP